MIKITSRAGYLIISPLPKVLEEELGFFDLVDKIKTFKYRDRDTGEMIEGTKRDGYVNVWVSLLAITETASGRVGCCSKGLYRRIERLLKINNLPFQYIEESPLDEFEFGPHVVSGGRPEQVSALLDLLAEVGCGQIGWQSDPNKLRPREGSGGAILSATMATGKTYIIAMLCRCFPNTKILVVTKKKAVLRRLYEGLTEILPEIAHDIGIYYGDAKRERRITVVSEALIDSFDQSQVGLIAYDEVHNATGQVIAAKLLEYSRAIKIGFSGTIERHKKYQFVESMFGPVASRITDEDAERLDRVSPLDVYVVDVNKGPDISAYKEVVLERKGITFNDDRNRLIGEIARMIPADMQTIVFVRTIDHINELVDEGYLPPGFVIYHGQLKDSERQRIEKGLCDGSILRLVANDALSEGVDTTHVRVILEGGWSTTDQTVSQRGGRARRRAEGKERGALITLADNWEIINKANGESVTNPLKAKASRRIANYSRRGWPVHKVKSPQEIDFSKINKPSSETPE